MTILVSVCAPQAMRKLVFMTNGQAFETGSGAQRGDLTGRIIWSHLFPIYFYFRASSLAISVVQTWALTL